MAGTKIKTAKIGSQKEKITGHRILNGKEVVPVLYYGKSLGYGKYISGSVNGELVCDTNGKPVPYGLIGISDKEFVGVNETL
jgi:hypothetical protein